MTMKRGQRRAEPVEDLNQQSLVVTGVSYLSFKVAITKWFAAIQTVFHHLIFIVPLTCKRYHRGITKATTR